MSIQEIEIQFDRMKELTEELTQTAEGIRKLAEEQGAESVSCLKAAWAGENAVVFAGKEETLLGKIQSSAQNLTVIAADIKEKARQLYEVEKWNCLVARARSYR